MKVSYLTTAMLVVFIVVAIVSELSIDAVVTFTLTLGVMCCYVSMFEYAAWKHTSIGNSILLDAFIQILTGLISLIFGLVTLLLNS